MEKMTNNIHHAQDGYNKRVEDFRPQEYPALKGVTYLDHGGSTIPAKSLLEDISRDLGYHLYGNPHSASAPSALAGHRVDQIRERTLRFFNADPEHFDLVFVANATAAMKVVFDSFRDYCHDTQKLPRNRRRKLWYGYHRDAHNSLIGIREAAHEHRCFCSDGEVEQWISGGDKSVRQARKKKQIRLFGYCGQSNMTGRRLPLSWPGNIRASPHCEDVYTLLDAAALATTAPLDFSNPALAPDFTCLSFYKIFGFPDLGGLIVRRSSSEILRARRYFGGGTVDMVTCLQEHAWHAKKMTSLHDHLEDGTLAFHSIIALDAAISTHLRLFTSMNHISAHTACLVKRMQSGMASLRHANGTPVIQTYNEPEIVFGNSATQGATVAFNVLHADGTPFGPSLVEHMADKHQVFLRSGSLCNPGGAATYLGWTSKQLRDLYTEGLRCSNPSEIVDGKPTGVVRASLGAMSTKGDVDTFLAFLQRVCLESDDTPKPFSSSLGREHGMLEVERPGGAVSESAETERTSLDDKRVCTKPHSRMRKVLTSCFTSRSADDTECARVS